MYHRKHVEHIFRRDDHSRQARDREAGLVERIWRCTMKGYVTDSGYMGFINGRYQLFACEADYIEYLAVED